MKLRWFTLFLLAALLAACGSKPQEQPNINPISAPVATAAACHAGMLLPCSKADMESCILWSDGPIDLLYNVVGGDNWVHTLLLQNNGQGLVSYGNSAQLPYEPSQSTRIDFPGGSVELTRITDEQCRITQIVIKDDFSLGIDETCLTGEAQLVNIEKGDRIVFYNLEVKSPSYGMVGLATTDGHDIDLVTSAPNKWGYWDTTLLSEEQPAVLSSAELEGITVTLTPCGDNVWRVEVSK